MKLLLFFLSALIFCTVSADELKSGSYDKGRVHEIIMGGMQGLLPFIGTYSLIKDMEKLSPFFELLCIRLASFIYMRITFLIFLTELVSLPLPVLIGIQLIEPLIASKVYFSDSPSLVHDEL